MRRVFLVPLVAAVLLGLAARPAAAGDRSVTVALDRAPLIDAVRFFSKLLDRNFVVADAVYGTRVTILTARPVTPEEAWRAFVVVAAAERLSVEEVGAFWVVDRARRRLPPHRPGPAPSAEAPEDPPAEAPPPTADACPNPEVAVTGDGLTYSLRRAEAEAAFGDLSCALRQARLIPHIREGRQRGIKVVGIRPGSLFDALGFRNGDVVLSLAGHALDRPDAALDAVEDLRRAERFEVVLERRGERRVHVFHVTGGAAAAP